MPDKYKPPLKACLKSKYGKEAVCSIRKPIKSPSKIKQHAVLCRAYKALKSEWRTNPVNHTTYKQFFKWVFSSFQWVIHKHFPLQILTYYHIFVSIWLLIWMNGFHFSPLPPSPSSLLFATIFSQRVVMGATPSSTACKMPKINKGATLTGAGGAQT